MLLAVTTATALGGAAQAQSGHGGGGQQLRTLSAAAVQPARVFQPEASRSRTYVRTAAIEASPESVPTTIGSTTTTAAPAVTPATPAPPTTITTPVTAAPAPPAVWLTPEAAAPRPQPAPVVYGGGGMAPRNSIEACISARENGGSYARSSNSAHFGRWQLSTGLWSHYAPGLESRFPGIGGRWGYASPAEQDAVFMAVVANDPGYNNWRPYDGC